MSDSGTARKASRFETVVMPHISAAHNLAHWLTRDSRMAEDLVQEACARALKFIDTFHGGNSRAWLLTIVRNIYYTELKKRRPEGIQVPFDENDVDTDSGSNASGLLPEHEDISVVLEREETRQAVRRALNALPEEFREILVLRELEELSYQEMAHVLQVPMGTVMSRLSRARKLLCRQLQSLRARP